MQFSCLWINFMQHRQQLILTYIETYQEASVQELATHLNVSLETIRRDLNKMAKEDLLYRTHGGAVSHKNRDIGRSFDVRRRMNSNVKKSIAENALEHFFCWSCDRFRCEFK